MSKGSCGLYCFMLLQKYKLWVEKKADKADNVHQLHSEEGFFFGNSLFHVCVFYSMFVWLLVALISNPSSFNSSSNLISDPAAWTPNIHHKFAYSIVINNNYRHSS